MSTDQRIYWLKQLSLNAHAWILEQKECSQWILRCSQFLGKMDPWSMKPHEHPGHFQLNRHMRTEKMLLASGRCGLVAYFLDIGRSIRWFITLTHHCKGNRSSQRSKVDIMVSGHSTSTEAIMLEDMMTRATSHYLQVYDSSQNLTFYE